MVFISMVELAACGGGGSDGASSGATAELNVAIVGGGTVSSQSIGIDCGIHCWLCCINYLKVEFPLTPDGFMAQ